MKMTEQALNLISDGMTLGLGTGKAAFQFINGLGERVAQGLKVRGVPTSEASADLARNLGIPLVSLEEGGVLDLAFDGADEVDPQLDLIKGYGGALVREKIVAASARRFIVLVGEEKLVPLLGRRGRLPVEVVPFALPLCGRLLQKLGFGVQVRSGDKGPFITDNGNLVLDCRCNDLSNLEQLERDILAIPGVVGTGLFLGMADVVLVEGKDGIVTQLNRERK